MRTTLREFSERFPRVYQLLAGYLNQDVTAAPDEAVNRFLADDPEQSEATAIQLRDFLEAFDDVQIEEVLDTIMVGYDFEADNLTARSWLTNVAAQLDGRRKP